MQVFLPILSVLSLLYRPQLKETIIFIELTDGTTPSSLQVPFIPIYLLIDFFQVVVDKSLPTFEELLKCDAGTSFRICGKIVKSPAAGQVIELKVTSSESHYAKILGANQDPKHYPLGRRNMLTYETLREIAHLRPRSRFIGAVSRIRNALSFATHLFFQSKGFLYVHTPIITATDCEGAGERFQVTTILPEPKRSIKEVPLVDKKDAVDYSKDFFKAPAYLTVSGQLAVESYCCALSNVYTFGPAFRAEKAHTTRHLAEFWMIEPEMAFADLQDNFELAEGYMKFCIEYVLQNYMDDLEFFEKEHSRKAKEVGKPAPPSLIENLELVAKTPFKKMTYTEGVEICLKVLEFLNTEA